MKLDFYSNFVIILLYVIIVATIGAILLLCSTVFMKNSNFQDRVDIVKLERAKFAHITKKGDLIIEIIEDGRSQFFIPTESTEWLLDLIKQNSQWDRLSVIEKNEFILDCYSVCKLNRKGAL